jgi:hypothetical protein
VELRDLTRSEVTFLEDSGVTASTLRDAEDRSFLVAAFQCQWNAARADFPGDRPERFDLLAGQLSVRFGRAAVRPVPVCQIHSFPTRKLDLIVCHDGLVIRRHQSDGHRTSNPFVRLTIRRRPLRAR